MYNSPSKSKRIAKNTVFLYVRMLLVMAVTLYTSRVILKALGFEDFGVYNVIGGVVASFGFFSSSLSNATQRFLNYELGKGQIEKVKEIFNLSLFIYVIISLVIWVLAETIGTWFISSKLVIPEARLDAALWVFHLTILSLVVTLIGIVFDSVLISRENMEVYAYSGIIDAVGKLIVAMMISDATCDKLKLYSALLLSVTILSKALPVLTCFKLYPECKIQFYWNKQLFVNMFKFVGWNGLGTAIWAINEQGMIILLNMFFGPVINAARAIATQVNTAVNNFSNNFLVAVRPQIIKSYAAKDYTYFIKLIFNSSKYSYFLMWILCLPIILRCEYILNLWLGEVPENTIVFVQWILAFSLVNVLTTPIWNAIQAVGVLRKYILVGSLVFLMAFPISYIFLKFGYAPVVTFQVLTIVRIVYVVVTIMILRSYIQFSVLRYIKFVILPITIVSLLSGGVLYYLNLLFETSFLNFIIISIISLIISIVLILVAGLSSTERNLLVNQIYKKK